MGVGERSGIEKECRLLIMCYGTTEKEKLKIRQRNKKYWEKYIRFYMKTTNAVHYSWNWFCIFS